MYKTTPMIYRFIFILLGVWGIFRKIGANILYFNGKFLSFAFVSDFLCLICILLIFINDVAGKKSKKKNIFKYVLTLSSALVLLCNGEIFYSGITYEWILGILLPIMMILDWLFFDEKQNFDWYDTLIQIFGVLTMSAVLSLFLKLVLGIKDLASVLGLFSDKFDFADKLLKLIIIAAVMLLINTVSALMKKKNGKTVFSLIYRFVFLVLEVFSFISIAGTELGSFIVNMRSYEFLSNFLCAVFMGIILIYSLISFGSSKMAKTLFPRLKGVLTAAVVFIFIAHFIFDRDIKSFAVSHFILYFITPAMMLGDWVLFDKKGFYALWEPLLWAIIPFTYFAALITFIIPRYGAMYERLLSIPQPEMFLTSLGVILIYGYAIYIADSISAKNR